MSWSIPLIFNEINWWSFADLCKKVITWTTRCYSGSSKGVLAEARRKVHGTEGRTVQDFSRKGVSKPRAVWRDIDWRGSFGGELFVDMHLLCQKWEWDMFVQPDSRLCEWMEISLPGFHIPSLFPNGSSTLWYRAMVTGSFLLTTPVMQLEAPPHCKQMDWAPPVLPKCTAQLCFPVCPKPTTSLIQLFGTLHPDIPPLLSYWDDFIPCDRIAFWFSKLCP